MLTAGKADKKKVYDHSGYPGGIRDQTYGEALARKPADAVRRTIRGMLPKNRLGRPAAQPSSRSTPVPSTRTPPRSPSRSSSTAPEARTA